MANAPVARRYAQALFDLGVEHDQLEELGDALQQTSDLFKQSNELRSVLLNPAIKLEERRNVIDAVAKKAGWPKLFRNFLLLVLDKDRLRHVGAVSESYAEKVDDHLGRARARVTSAVELNDDQQDSLRARLGDLTGKEVVLTTEVDDALIGGIIARVGGTIYDGSVRTHLQRMREAILREV